MDGRLVPRVEALAQAVAERAVELVISALDVNALLDRVDINRMLDRVDINEVAGRPSRTGRAAAACVRSLLAAALHGTDEHPDAGTQEREVAEHLDDEHDPGCLGFRGDIPETHR